MIASHLLESAGMSAAAAASKAGMFAALRGALGAAGTAAHAWFVPGRIEILGKHTDYGGGRSLLCAAERGVCIMAVPRRDDRVVVRDVKRLARIDIPIHPDLDVPSSGWENYVSTVMRRVARNFPAARRGADIVFASDLPSSSGMSSSSALLTSMFLAIAEINGLTESEPGA